MDAIASEAIEDTVEGVKSFQFLVENGELDSACNRLSETFVIGEYMRPIRTLARSEKRRVLEYYQKSQDLITALDVKAYDRATELVEYLEKNAKDFDATRAKSAIKTATNLAAMHLAKAKNAAMSGDHPTFEAEIKEATAVWPTNPMLMEVAGQVFSKSDVRQTALIDFDQLFSQHNYRRIFEEQARFIGATADDADRQAQLTKVIKDVAEVDFAIVQAQTIEKHGDQEGAWEIVDRARQTFPEDTKLNSMHSAFTTKSSVFVAAVTKAKAFEEQKQLASSLSWYLKAQSIYPESTYAREGIDRLVSSLMPDASVSN